MTITTDVANDTPRATMSLLEKRVTALVIGLLVGLAGAAWYLTARQAAGMSDMVSGLGQVGGRMPADMTAPLFLAMWTTMMVAMMFPTIAPFVLAHRMVVRKRNEGSVPTVAFVLGYLVVWTAAGTVPLAAFLAFRGLTDGAGWLHVVAGATLVIAGVYQFTPWKATCLKHCRSPLGFLMTHDFRRGPPGAFEAGLRHGAVCLGCCWALMAVLVIVGLMNLVWMAGIALVFLAEKNWKYGRGLTRVAGVAIAALGIAVVLSPDVLRWISGVSGTVPDMSGMGGR